MIKKPIVNILHIGEKRKNNMKENEIIEKAQEFLRNVSDDELEELINSNDLEFLEVNHIMRKFVNYCYDGTGVQFLIGMTAVYPQIAKEAFRRYKQYRQHFDKLAEDYEISRNNGKSN